MKKTTLGLMAAFAATFVFAYGLHSASAQDILDDFETYEDGFQECAETIKTCGADDVLKAHKKMRDACSALRQCKQGCKGDKQSCKQAAKESKRDCKAECNDEKQCKKQCKKEMKDSRKICRKDRKACTQLCKDELKDKQCKDARKEFWKTVGKAAKQCVDAAKEGCSDVFPK